MEQYLKSAQQTLEFKLGLLAKEGMTIELTLEEAAVYGVDYSDCVPQEKEVDDGQ